MTRPAASASGRPAGPTDARSGLVAVEGKRFVLDGRRFPLRGVTYGSFLARADGEPFPSPFVVQRDFTMMRQRGLNTIRTYAVPPPDVIEGALEAGLRVLIGLHYDDWRMYPPGRRSRQAIHDAGRSAADRALDLARQYPEAVLGVAVGNEIPGDVVRVHGIGAVQEGLSELVGHIHGGVPLMLATYVNFPTTEYLNVDGADFVAFNVFLERTGELARYIPHLHVIADDKPVVISELGLAAGIYGADRQADFLRTQLDEVDESGAAGAFVFAWTDEWGVGGEQVDGWEFGLTSADREPKLALDVVEHWALRDLRDLRSTWPEVSVVVCAYNEERYIGQCLDSISALDYPGLDVVVCDDGSTDRTREIASRYPFRLLALEHAGLSAARNAGLLAARGEIIAYLDADAACDPDWPFHLALSLEGPVDATGGPNLPVPGAGFQERVVASSPGGPVQVLTADDRAEHVAGCNMAFRRDTLLALGGFDTSYTSAGDDVDVCWRLLDAGHQIGFAHAAQVWHHRRDSVMRYLKQQRGYGRSERMVSGRHAERFNRLGQARWSGFLYSAPRLRWPLLRPLLYHGYLGSAPFQRVTRWRADIVMQMCAALLPLLAPAAVLGLAAAPFSLWFLIVPGVAIAIVGAFGAAAGAAIRPSHTEPHPRRLRCLCGVLHAVQPFVRAWGRLRAHPLPPQPNIEYEWTGDRTAWLGNLQRELGRGWRSVRPGGPSSSWDLSLTVGPLLEYRITAAVVWAWQPMWHGRLVPRPASVVAVAAAGLLPLVDATLAAVSLAALVLVGAEALILQRVARRAVATTTNATKPAPTGTE